MGGRNRRGLLIAIEGIDGAGKTTQASMLRDFLSSRGISVRSTKEPTNGPFGRRLRESATRGRLDATAELELFIEDRREHVEKEIAPALAAGEAVIVDRYYFSTAAYQGARGLDPEEILERNQVFAPVPDLLILLKISPATAMERIEQRGVAANLFEKEAELAKCAAIFDRIEGRYVLRLDGENPPDAIHARIAARVDELLSADGARSAAAAEARPLR